MFIYPKRYDVIVVGAGHAGCEAALAAAKMGCSTLLLTMNLDTIGLMSCNPAIGGIGKGQLVKEIDALGGIMARLADKTALSFRQLNTKKGQAVRSTRVQTDRQKYRIMIRQILEKHPAKARLELRQGVVARILTKENIVIGVETETGEQYLSKTVVVTPGTFLNGLVHIGLVNFPSGRLGEAPSTLLSENLKELGFEMGRFKTGTPARLDGRTINFKKLEAQYGDEIPQPFSFWTRGSTKNRLPCYITYTNPKTHQIVKSGLSRSPLYTGIIKGTGVRYCPSIEDKVVKFPEKERHQVFLEPEGLNTVEYYPNGVSTSLPIDIQIKFLRSIQGLEDVEIFRPGYAIEYDYCNPTQLKPSLETKIIENLFFAGQINGTTGYEEAGAQGLVAGINAALKAKEEPPFILKRSEAYIGVMIDDLVTKGTNEPYRMFTSRVEYRLLLREDNADLRLGEYGRRFGLLSRKSYEKILNKKKRLEAARDWLKKTRLKVQEATNQKLKSFGTTPIKDAITFEELLRRPEITIEQIKEFASLIPLPPLLKGDKKGLELLRILETEIKYQGYIERTLIDIKKFEELEAVRIPSGFDFNSVHGLSFEVREKLSKFRPFSLGQAQRIPGITPSAIFNLFVYLKK